ncbi:hypothetical protein HO979_09950 [Streptococcus suis]|nr:hypothetical protein [Streptococcus suis]NQO24564.1 hypothetical protein [Streptococcus suis]HEP1809550.1 hypothetical protein [Streptococcus suis]
MKELAKEVYSNTLHIWYETDVTTAHEYGEIFDTSSSSLDKIATRIQADVADNPDVEAVYWYMGKGLDQLALMARYQQGSLQVQVNLKDFDFALHLDAVEAWKNALITRVQVGLLEK